MLLLMSAVVGALPAVGQDHTIRIIGVVHEVAPQAGVLFVGEGVIARGAVQAILLCPQTRIIKLERDSTYRITKRPAAADEIRRGDVVEVTATRSGGRLRAAEVRIAPKSGD